MAEKIRVHTKRLLRTGNLIDAQVRIIRREIGRLEQDAADLQAIWEGEAARAFHTAFADDVKMLDSQCRELDRTAAGETEASREYERCEGKISGLIAGISV